MNGSHAPTVGSLFAGIGGFDLGFERAGFRTRWQVEINPDARAVLARRFPDAVRHTDVRAVTGDTLGHVDCICAGFPCQDISNAGNSRKDKENRGLAGKRSGLFSEVARLLREIQPRWVVLENVEALLAVNDGEDFQTVVRTLADCGYLGFWRVLDARYFGVPQGRRRVFLVGGLGAYPPFDLLSDAGPVEELPRQMRPLEESRESGRWAGYTLAAKIGACQIQIGGEILVAEEDGWDQMVERERSSRVHGIPLGLDGPDLVRHHAAGNAVVPAVAEWIARKLILA